MDTAAKSFPARMAALHDLLAYVSEICRNAGLSGDAKTKVELVIEELFCNTVAHGYQQDSDQAVWIAFAGEVQNLRLLYQDEAPAFNPLNLPGKTSENALGGWGMRLIENFADAAYHYENGRNTLTLVFKLSPPAESPGTHAG